MDTEQPDKILLFIPMYNCRAQIIRVLSKIDPELCSYISEMIIVNNRSTDDGEQTVIDYLKENEMPIKVSVLRNKENYGLGGSHKVAFRYGLENGFDYLIVLHGDDQASIEDLKPLLVNGGYRNFDCLLGARFMKGSVLEGYSRFRTFGNRVYNILFSIVTHKRVYDLGSGLNMYNLKMFKDGFHIKYADNLEFNYCMILGSSYYKHNCEYFPISWREEDQKSNVKMMSQATHVLRMLMSYAIRKKRFVTSEHRTKIVESYDFDIIYTSE